MRRGKTAMRTAVGRSDHRRMAPGHYPGDLLQSFRGAGSAEGH
jgi:hypothetical protein